MLGFALPVQFIQRSSSLSFDFRKTRLAALLPFEDVPIATLIECAVHPLRLCVDSLLNVSTLFAGDQRFEFLPRLFEEPNNAIPVLGDERRKQRPRVSQEIDGFRPRRLQPGPRICGDLCRPEDRFRPGGEEHILHFDPDLIQRIDALLPLQFERQPEYLRGQPNIAGRQRITDSLPGSECRLFERIELVTQPAEGLTTDIGRGDQIGGQCSDAGDHQSDRRKQRAEHRSKDTDRRSDAGDDRRHGSECRRHPGNDRPQHNERQASGSKCGGDFGDDHHQPFVLFDPGSDDLHAVGDLRDQGSHNRQQRGTDDDGRVIHFRIERFHLVGERSGRADGVSLRGGRAPHDDRHSGHHLLLFGRLVLVDSPVQQLLFDGCLVDDHAVLLHHLAGPGQCSVQIADDVGVSFVVERSQVDRQPGELLAHRGGAGRIKSDRDEQVLCARQKVGDLFLGATDLRSERVAPRFDDFGVASEDDVELVHRLFHIAGRVHRQRQRSGDQRSGGEHLRADRTHRSSERLQSSPGRFESAHEFRVVGE